MLIQRHHRWAGTLVVLAIAATGAGAVAAPGRVSALPPPAPALAVAWTPCPEDPTAQCARLPVPVDWADPTGPSIEVALARRPATDPAARIGSLVLNPGGPGVSGVDLALFAAGEVSTQIRSRFDLVGFDPRGVGRSHPVACSPELLARLVTVPPTTRAEFAATVAGNRRLRADCRARTGPLYDHLDTLSVVRDLDRIRAALGDERLTYWGGSYGTLIGQQYAELFPGRVRALALDSLVDHSLDLRELLDTSAVAAQDSFDEFVAWCARAAGCPLHGQDVRSLWRRLLDRAARGELPDPADPGRRARPADLLSFAFYQLVEPNWAALARSLVALAAGEVPDVPSIQADPLTATVCADLRLAVPDYRAYAAHLRRLARIAPDIRFSPLTLLITARCLGAPSGLANPPRRLVVGDVPPLLLLNARHDPATGWSWARGVARQLGARAVLVQYDGWGHGAYLRTECTRSVVDRYLVELALPRPGTHCAAAVP